DQRGFLFLTGRKSDMYISGGSNVYPREIEELLLTDDEVAQAVVVGVPDAQWGEIGVAIIEPVAAPAEQSSSGESSATAGRQAGQPGELPEPSGQSVEQAKEVSRQRLRELCRSTLAVYKVPKEIHFVEAMPVTAYGKLARNELKDEYSAGRGSPR
ncbi:MAG: hypothetical protein L0L36_11630, partial [Brevibacterium sp.]|nr:hypothetical protein [Brevibacterium sp.]